MDCMCCIMHIGVFHTFNVIVAYLICVLNSLQMFSGDFSSIAGDGSSGDDDNEDGQGKKVKVLFICNVITLSTYR